MGKFTPKEKYGHFMENSSMLFLNMPWFKNRQVKHDNF